MLNDAEQARVAKLEAMAQRVAEIGAAHEASSSLFMTHEQHYELQPLIGKLASAVPDLLALVQRLAGAADGQGE